ncbi:MAG: DUF559 domain-containing protein [Bacteroidales bacterium]|nr:DUF559 domain-containing protein [Bacteroidales bacterium]
MNISQLKFDRTFLEKMLSKLTVGTGRSIHLNAIPGKLKTRLDIMDLSISVEEQDLFADIVSEKETKKKLKEDKIAQDFLKILLTKDKFKFPISWDNKNLNKMTDDQKQALSIISKRLDSIVADNEDMYLETGIKNFGFGYPLLVKPDRKDPKKFVVAPIFVWSLDIEKSTRKNEWSISKSEDSPIKVNELLISHIENDEKISLPKLTSEELDDNILSEFEITGYLDRLFEKLGVNNRIANVSLEKCPSKDKIESLVSGTPWIQWSGILGLYRSQKEPIIESTRELLNNLEKFNEEDLEIEPFQTTTTSSFETDPSQSEIINTLNFDEFKVIQGPPGTGKSQAISAIISNALANGAKTLVVCEKKTALDVLASNLQKKQLDNFCIVVDDVAKDRRHVVEKARGLQEYSPSVRNFDEETFKTTHNRFITLRDSVNNLYKESSRPIFAGETWKDIVGKFLKNSKSEHFDKIKDRFSKAKFLYTPDEMATYINNIRTGDLLFTQVKDLNESDFSLLDMSQFGDSITIKEKKEIEQKVQKSHEIIASAKSFLKKSDYICGDLTIGSKTSKIESEISTIDSGLDLCKSVKNMYKSELSPDLIKDLNEKFTEFNKLYKRFPKVVSVVDIDTDMHDKVELLNNIIDLSNSLSEVYKTGIELLGDKFDNKSIGLFKRFFSGNADKAQKCLNELKDAFKIIRSTEQEFSKFEDFKLNLNDWDDYSTISETLEDIKSGTKIVEKQKSKILKNLQKTFDSAVSQVEILENQKKCLESIIKCKNFITKTDNSLVATFQLVSGLSGDYESLDFYKNTLKSIDDNLAILSDRLSDLDNYNKWIKFKNTNKLLFDNLLKVPVEEWENDFKGVYYYNFLLHFDTESKTGFHRDEAKLDLLRKLHGELQEQNIKRIYAYWHAQRNYAIQELENDPGFKSLFALKKNQRFGKRLSLRQIIEWDFDLFTDLFPVIMVNPIVANALLPLKQGLFDLVIFDEASQLRIEDIYTSMLRGKYKIIAGDQHQMPPSNYFAAGLDGTEGKDNDNDQEIGDKIRQSAQLDAESLLAFAETLKIKNMSYLDFHYRSKHPALINFSNAAFYGGNLCPLPVNGADYRPIILKEVNGVYESGKGRNINKDEAFAVVNLIADIKEDPDGTMPSVGIATFNIHQRNCIRELLYQTAYDNEDFGKKFEKLQKSGLFIKNLENVQGDERDIIIISTTFGPDETGKFYERFATIGQDNGYKLLNVLVTRAKKQLYLVTSIPHSKYSAYKELIDSKQENNRKAILYAYIAYAKAISEGLTEVSDGILQDLRQFSYDLPRVGQASLIGNAGGLTESVFEEEVYNEIVQIIGEDAIHPQFKIGGYRLDFMLDINGYKIALECDGKAYHNTDQAYAEDMQRQKWIEQFGYKFHRIWSTNWFEDKNKEVLKFQRFINQFI